MRVVSALVLAAVLIPALAFNAHSRFGVVALGLVLGAWEFSRMLDRKLAGPGAAWYAGLVVLLFILPRFPGLALPEAHWAWGVTILAVLSFTLLGFIRLAIENMAPWIYLQLFGCGYFGLYAAALFGLLDPVIGWKGLYPLLMIQVLIATADTGAYLTGKAWGRRKLCPSISAKKTVEGAAGGAALTIGMALLLGPVLLGTGTLANLGLGMLMACTAILGDLFISVVKRYTGTKDSSQLIPGHGGVLDRFDSLLFSAPVAVFYLGWVR